MDQPPSILLLAADAVLAAHLLFAGFILGGFALIWIGRWRGWAMARNRAFRLLHAAAMALVAGESLVGVFCPLTEWEWRLREAARGAGMAGGAAALPESFLHHWAERLFYLDLPEWAFTVGYVGFAALVGVTFWLVPMNKRKDRDLLS